MSGAPSTGQDFVDRVMGEVARQERRRVPVAVALAMAVFVLAVPALVALKARPALGGGLSLAAAAMREIGSAVADNPFFWGGVAITAGWLGWLVSRALWGRA